MSNEIKCPHCGEVFLIDESNYDAILKQVRDKEFNALLSDKQKQFESEKKTAVEMAKMAANNDFQKQLNVKEKEISDNQSRIHELLSQIQQAKSDQKIAVQDALNNQQEEINRLHNQLENLQKQADMEKQLSLSQTIAAKDQEIAEMKREMDAVKQQLSTQQINAQLTLQQQISTKENEISELKSQLTFEKQQSVVNTQNQKASYENMLKMKDDQIAYYKDLKARQSTKMIGETLEKHCEYEFNRLRATAFRNAYFEKDNDARSGSKGDYIFKDYDEGGDAFISIMFEMKNEADETATKHKNEDFLKELDKDRREKGCEYAVLVSMLEIDNDLYNEGIVDMSHKYEKMYVIRPQFFIPIITILRNAALNSLDYRRELIQVKNQNIDIANFEENMNTFKEGFARNYELASTRFKTAIDEIDKSIQHLQKIKEALTSSENNLRLANNKAQDLSIKRLTKNSPTMAKAFEDAKNK